MSIESQPDSPLRIDAKKVGDVVVLSLSGHIDELGADALSTTLDETMEGGSLKIVVDLTDVLFMSSTGLGQIMRTYRVVRAGDGYIKIVNPQPLIADLFTITKLDKLLDIYPTVDAALQDA
jgi:anti-sigma B factor antagonist